MEGAEEQLPRAGEVAERLRPYKEKLQTMGIDMSERLQKLRLTIQKTRELTNKIKVGVAFLPNTTVEVVNPSDLTKASTSTKVKANVDIHQFDNYFRCSLVYIFLVQQ